MDGDSSMRISQPKEDPARRRLWEASGRLRRWRLLVRGLKKPRRFEERLKGSMSHGNSRGRQRWIIDAAARHFWQTARKRM